MSKVPFFVRRFVAGTDYEDTVPCMEQLSQLGIKSTINILGENCANEQQARDMCELYLQLINKMRASDCYLSLKLTMIGLDCGDELASELLHKMLASAQERGLFVRLDMEGSTYTDRTINIYEKAKQKFNNVGIVLQAYLKRTQEDLLRLQKVDAKIRLCKGAYKETADIAFQSIDGIRNNYLALADTLFTSFSDTAFATHDDFLLTNIKTLAKQKKIAHSKFEFQMLYGMRQRTWQSLREQDYSMRVYIPFGDSWFPYFSRRLLERKENILFLVRNFFKN